MKIQRVFIDNGQTNRQTDEQTEKLIRCGLTTSQRRSTAFLAEKKTSIFFPVTTEQNITRVNLFRKPSVSFYLMAIVVIVAIHQECIIPVALFNGAS